MKMLWKKWTKAALMAVIAALMLAAFSACSNGEESDETTEYTVMFDSKGGSDVPSQSVENGKKAVEPKDPTKNDVTFGDWYEGETPFSFSTAITGDITLTAKWISEQYTNNSVTLTFYDDQTFEYKDADGTSQGTYTKTDGKIKATFTSGSKSGTLEVDTSGSGPSVSVGGNEVGGFEQVEEPTNQNPQDNDSSTPASGAKLDGTALYRFGMTNLDCDFNVKGELTNFGDTGSFLYYPVALNLDADTAELSATISVSKAVANSKLGVGLIILNDNHSVTGFTFATTEQSVRFLGGTSSDVNADGSHGENSTNWDDSTLGIDKNNKKKLLTENIPYTFKVRLEKKGIAFTVTDSTDAIAARENPHDYTELVGNNGKAYLAIGSILGDTSIITYSNINVTINDKTCTIDSIKSRSSTALDETVSLCRFGADQNCDFDSNGVLTDFGGSGSFLYYPVALNLSTDIAQLSANITVTNAIERMGIGIIVVDDDGFIASHVIATTATKVRYFGGTKAPDREHSYVWNNSTLNADNGGNKVVLPTNVPYTFKVTLVGGRIFFSIFDSSGNLAGDVSESYSIWLNSNGKVYFAIGAFSGDTSNIAYSDIKVRINDGQCTINSIKDGISSKIPYLIVSGKTVIGYRDDIPAKLTIPNSITAIEQKAFMGCTSLTSVTIPDGVTTIGSSAFRECTSLQSVNIQNGITEIAADTFKDCTLLTSITIPNSVETIGEGAFSWCESLVSVTIPDTVTKLDKYAFDCCKALKSIEIPQNVTTIGDFLFNGCDNLERVVISANLITITNSMFQNCYNLIDVNIPSSVTSIEDNAFTHCFGLKNMEIPSNVTSIGNSAFEGSGLTSITIPSSVTEIGENAFIHTNIWDIYYAGTKELWEKISTNIGNTPTMTIHCTDGDIRIKGSSSKG